MIVRKWWGLVGLLLASNAWAGPANFRVTTEVRPPPGEARFEQGYFEFSLVSGALFSPPAIGFPDTDTSFNYTVSELRFGVMLNSPWEAGFLRGNFELLFGFGGGAVIEGPGTVLANAELIIRYNFVPPHAVVVPYWQLGIGLFASDASGDHTQRLIGRGLEFTVQTGVGLRFLLNARWSLEIEGIYEHVSNGDTVPRNVGVNAFGGLLGVTYSL